jgi:hypothetical protein
VGLTTTKSRFLDRHAPLSLFVLIMALIFWSFCVGFVLSSVDAYSRIRGMLDRGELASWQPATEPGTSERHGTVKWLLRYIDYAQIQRPDGSEGITQLHVRTRWGMAVLIYSAGCAVLVSCYVLWRRFISRWKRSATEGVHTVG